MAIHLFLDFDGTVSQQDVGDEFFKRFGTFEPAHSQLLAGECSVKEYYQRAVSGLPESCTPDSVAEFVESQELDPGFSALTSWCLSEGIRISVVSDGFDIYISPMLSRVPSFANITVNSNRLVWDGQSFSPHFPGATESCNCFCASCKRNALITNLADDDIAVYVGDGRSDFCVVEFADVVFAKGALAGECTRRGIPHHHYRTLFDVMIMMQTRLSKGAFRGRRLARMARKSAFEGE